jgi:hypothetical protein
VRVATPTASTIATWMALMTLAGCGAGVAHRVPTTAPASIAASRVDADVAACEKTAPPNTAYREWTYASCMIARGYTAYVQVPIWAPRVAQKNFVAFNATAKRRQASAQTFKDLASCAARTEREARPNAALTAFTWPNSPVDYDAVERVFGGCMGDRGYAVKLWRPDARPSW